MKTDWTCTHYGSKEGYFALDGVEERGGGIWTFAQFHRTRSQQQQRVQSDDSGVSVKRVAECLVSWLMQVGVSRAVFISGLR